MEKTTKTTTPASPVKPILSRPAAVATPSVESVPTTPAIVNAPVLTEVRMLHSDPIMKEGVNYLPVVTTGSDPKGYLVKAESVQNTRSPQKIDLSAATELYDWSDEINYLIPDVETVRKNLKLSFWSAGAYEQKDAANNAVRNHMFDRAYPYRLP